MFKRHQDPIQHNTITDGPILERKGSNLMDTLSSLKDGVLTLSMVNRSLSQSDSVTLNVLDNCLSGKALLTALTHNDPNTCNTFEDPFAVLPVTNELDLREKASLILPPACVAMLSVKL